MRKTEPGLAVIGKEVAGTLSQIGGVWPFLELRECSCFCINSDMITEYSCFCPDPLWSLNGLV